MILALGIILAGAATLACGVWLDRDTYLAMRTQRRNESPMRYDGRTLHPAGMPLRLVGVLVVLGGVVAFLISLG